RKEAFHGDGLQQKRSKELGRARRTTGERWLQETDLRIRRAEELQSEKQRAMPIGAARGRRARAPSERSRLLQTASLARESERTRRLGVDGSIRINAPSR